MTRAPDAALPTLAGYDPDWPRRFEEIRGRIAPALAGLGARVEHVGGTAVPDLPAKPIIDMDIVLPSVPASSAPMAPPARNAPRGGAGKTPRVRKSPLLSGDSPGLAAASPAAAASMSGWPEVLTALTRLGYVHQGDRGIPGREAFRAPPGMFRHHLYVCAEHAAALDNHLRFRDFLRAHPAARRRYAALKRRLARRHPHDRDAYNRGKTDFIVASLKDAGLAPELAEAVRTVSQAARRSGSAVGPDDSEAAWNDFVRDLERRREAGRRRKTRVMPIEEEGRAPRIVARAALPDPEAFAAVGVRAARGLGVGARGAKATVDWWALWREVAGPAVAADTEGLSFRGGWLTATCRSAARRAELERFLGGRIVEGLRARLARAGHRVVLRGLRAKL